MKDFPVFTTENGVASIILKEVPYRKIAYVRMQSSLNSQALLEDCIGFCRVCGAQTVYCSDELLPEGYPLHTSILEMCGVPDLDPTYIENLFPVTEASVSRWRQLHNEAMKEVDNAATLETRDEDEILKSGGAYFIHRAGEVIGIGWLRDCCMEAIAAVQPGMGLRTAHTLLSVYPGQSIHLQVASTNTKAIRLYEKLGLLTVREVSRWYKVYPLSRKNT